MLESDAALGGIGFETVDRPLVSVVIPAYECFDETTSCLRALSERTPTGLCEAIVVDDGSTDPSFERLANVPGLTLKRMKQNSGFTLASNAGAAEALGEFIFFLNNDTEVRTGWLLPLLEAMEDPTVGAVGSRLLNPDGSLQEAGSIVFDDASAANIGRNATNPYEPEYSFKREVDYCSAAALLVRTDLFRELGGFDTLFSPGFYEDSDICFQVWARGFRVLYEPRSVVTHVGGRTFGTHDSEGRSEKFTKSGQVVNQYRFLAKWGDELLLHRGGGPVGGLDRGRRVAGPAVLVVDEKLPEPDRESGGLRLYWILRLLVEHGCRVTFLAADTMRLVRPSQQLAALGVEVWVGLDRDPWSELRQRQGLYDVVIVTSPASIPKALETISFSQPRAMLVYDTVDLHELRLRRELELGFNRLSHVPAKETAEVERATQLERLAIARADIIATVSEDEAARVRELSAGTPTIVLPNVHEERQDEPPDFEERSGLLFIGSYKHSPNVDAALHLVRDVLPLLAGRLDLKTVLLGSDPPAAVRDLASSGIEVPGYVEDVTGHFDAARVFVAPLRYGAGMKGKIGHAMALGLPVVTTPIGAEGMGLVDGKDVLVADSPGEIAEAILRLHDDPGLWAHLAKNGRQLVAQRWSPEAMGRRLDQLLADCLPPARRRTYLPRNHLPPDRPQLASANISLVRDLTVVGLAAARSPATLPQSDGAQSAPVPSLPERPPVVSAGGHMPSRRRTEVGLAPSALSFTCNVCGARCQAVASELRRDVTTCFTCGSTLRHRAIVAALTYVFGGAPDVLQDMVPRPDVMGIGIADWSGHSYYLGIRYAYTNTYRRRHPVFDLTRPLNVGLRSAHDFVTCCDRLQSFQRGRRVAIRNTFELLRPGGTLVVTVSSGFESLRHELAAAGFDDVRLFTTQVPEHGVVYPDSPDASQVPILATRPAS